MPTALITGASRGIGAETAKLFAESGWDLLLTASDETKLQSLSEELINTGAKIFYKALDLSKPDLISNGIAELLDKELCPSVLINNAGVAWTGELLTMPLKKWDWLFQINLTSVFQISAAVVPVMREKGGLVINVSSHAAHNAFPQWGAYCISKSALASFTKCLAAEERKNSIRSCTLTIGSVDSSLWDSQTVKGDFDRDCMLSVQEVASQLLHMASQSPKQVVEDLILMPASGAF